MNIKQLGLIGLVSFLPMSLKSQDSLKINLNLPKEKIEIFDFYFKNFKKTQYEIPLKKNLFLFTEYNSLKQNNNLKVTSKEIPYLSLGLKIKF